MIQSGAGFGMAMFGVPALVWSGRSLSEAVAVLLGASIVQNAYGTWMVRRDLDRGLVGRFVLLQYLCIPIGILGMRRLDAGDAVLMRQVVGVVVLVLVTLWLLVRPKPRESIGGPWWIAAGSGSGLLSGLMGMGGPPLVFWAVLHNWDASRFKAFLWPQFLAVLPLMAAMLVWTIGWRALGLFAVGVVAAPLLAIAVRIGVRLSRRWGPAELRRVVAGLLYLVGVAGALAPWLPR